MAQEWKIRPRGHVCQACEQDFQDGETCFSVLQLQQKEDSAPGEIERIDRCRKCWESQDTGKPSIVWQGEYRSPEPPPEDPAPRQTVETLLRSFLESEDSVEHAPVIYILAVMLERKKILIEREVREQPSGELLRFYEHRRTGEAFLISDPGLRVEALREVQEQIVRLLSEPDEKDAAANSSEAGPGLQTQQADSGDSDQNNTDKHHHGTNQTRPGEVSLNPEH